MRWLTNDHETIDRDTPLTRSLPIIFVLLIALVVFLVDPARRAGPMIEPATLPTATDWQAPTIEGWTRNDDESERLPRAYPPHNAIWRISVAYYTGAPGVGSEAYLRVVIAQDCRDLLAFEPTQAMRAGGWEPVDAQATGGLWRTTHTSHAGLLDEFVILDTAFVVPGRWGSSPSITSAESAQGPGWPGPGAIVQVLFSGAINENAQAVREEVRRMANVLAQELETAGTP